MVYIKGYGETQSKGMRSYGGKGPTILVDCHGVISKGSLKR